MINVGFKLGLQSSVDNIIDAGKGAEEGSFYLTSDTHRLYIGAKNGDDAYASADGTGTNDITLYAVNEGVTTVDSMSELPDYSSGSSSAAAGRFYYISADNILCVWTGQKWVQINPDTDTTISSSSKWELSESDDVATITLNLITDTSNGATGVAHRISYSLITRNGIVTEIDDQGRLVLEGDTYQLSHNAAEDGKTFTISLDSQNTDNDSTIKFKGNENVTFFKDDDGVINLQVSNTGISSLEVVNGQSPTDSTKSGFSVVVKDSTGAAVRGSFNPVIKVGHDNSQKQSYNFQEGVADLDVYTGDELEDLLKQLNAMIYKGLMGVTGIVAVDSIAVSGNDTNLMLNGVIVPASIGDTYMTSTDISYGNKVISKGSLVICNSKDHTENANGTIDADKLELDIVEISTSVDTTYELISCDNTVDGKSYAGIKLKSNVGVTSGELRIEDDGTGGLKVTSSHKIVSGQQGDIETITLTHTKLANGEILESKGDPKSQGAVGSLTIPVLTKIVTDDMGHIQEIETADYTVTDTNSNIEKVEILSNDPYVNVEGAMVGSFEIKAQTKNAAGQLTTKHDYLNIISDSLTISKNSKYGSNSTSTEQQAGLQIDMVWGSF